MDNYLLIADHQGYDKQIHVSDKSTFVIKILYKFNLIMSPLIN